MYDIVGVDFPSETSSYGKIKRHTNIMNDPGFCSSLHVDTARQ